ncbi:MAG: radical SAM protein [Candidatus Lokiarchaeota archaeon]|nr:radical SAM protein [Candidatus Lokiarchaeota archaeon]
MPSEHLEKIFHDVYHRKVELLLNGLRLTQQFIDEIRNYTPNFYRGRKGGAGPAGGRYFFFKETGSVVNVALWGPQSEHSYLELIGILGKNNNNLEYITCKIQNAQSKNSYSVDLIPIPTNYNEKRNLNSSFNKQIALIHGTSCLASTIIQKCRYWGEKTACAFCGIEYSLQEGATIEKKSSEQLIRAIRDARKFSLCNHITLTMGTLSKPDKGAENYIEIVSSIKKKYPNLPIHIQIEPFDDIDKLFILKKVGVDTIGVHLEIPNDQLRKNYCPGKSETSRSTYEKFWKKCIEIFGRGQVSTFVLLGFGENNQETIRYNTKLIKMGVIPNIMPVRYIMGTNLEYKPISLANLIEIYDSAAESLLNYQLDPHLNKAGCIRCMGCSAIIDAYDYHKVRHQNK